MGQMIRGEVLAALASLPEASADVLIADPPYSSGGLFRSDRARSTGAKYVRHDIRHTRPDYAGDNRDGRSYHYWVALWLSEALRVVRPGGYALIFTDWRQLPTTTDALQAGGFLWRGIVPWDKGEGARAPHTGYFRHQCEYVVWGTHGPCPKAHGRGPFPGVRRHTVKQADKHHQAGKPVAMMAELLRCCPPGGAVLDLFAGSGPVAVACAELGLRYTGVEREPTYAEMTARRSAAAGPKSSNLSVVTPGPIRPRLALRDLVRGIAR